MVYAPVRIDAPPIVPPRGGLLPVADVVDETNGRLVGFGAEYQTFLCSGFPGFAEQEACTTGGNPKVPFAGSIAQVEHLTLYSAVQCDLFGDNYSQVVNRVLTGWEDKYLGQWVQLAMLIPANGTNLGSVTSITEAVAVLEQYAGENYAGLPTIHMSRAEATRAIGAQVVMPGLDWSLTTGQGTPVANSSGYLDDDVIWITGTVHVWRGPIDTYETPDVMSNQRLALAERSYAVSIDCIRAYVTVTSG